MFWKHYSYALVFTRNNNPVTLRVSLVLGNPLRLELISSANPFKEENRSCMCLCRELVSVNWLHCSISIHFFRMLYNIDIKRDFFVLYLLQIS